jgi:hypothetical protein
VKYYVLVSAVSERTFERIPGVPGGCRPGGMCRETGHQPNGSLRISPIHQNPACCSRLDSTGKITGKSFFRRAVRAWAGERQI